MDATSVVRSLLPSVFRCYGIASLLDLPCGDFHWMQYVDLGGVLYLGADIVKSLVEENRKSHPEFRFLHLDLIKDKLPKMDAVLCRDCLQHLSFEDGLNALNNLRVSGCKYLLATTYVGRSKNVSIATGGWTPYNLQVNPFNLPLPRLLINEECHDYYPGFTDKCLGVWGMEEA